MKRRAFILALAAILAAACLALAAWYYLSGSTRQRYLADPVQEGIAAPHEAYDRWKALGMKGRVLLLFDTDNHAGKSSRPGPGPENFVYLAAQDGIIKEVYHVLPAWRWQEARPKLEGNEAFTFYSGAFHTTMEGTPLHVTDVAGIAALSREIGEPALVLITLEAWAGDGWSDIVGLLRGGGISYDLMLHAGAMPEGGARGQRPGADYP